MNKTTGEVLWQREFPGMLSALARTTSGLILAARQAIIDNKPHLVFLWIDPADGSKRAAYGHDRRWKRTSPFFLGRWPCTRRSNVVLLWLWRAE